MKKIIKKSPNAVSFTVKKVADYKTKSYLDFKKTFPALAVLAMVFYLILPGLSQADPPPAQVVQGTHPPIAQGTLVVKKVVVGSYANPSEFSFSVNGGAPIVFDSSGENDIGEDVSVSAGPYTVTEATAEGYNTTYDNCAGLQVTVGASVTCTIANTFTPPPASTGKVHIEKYLDGSLATTESANGYQFPMVSTWNAQNIGFGSGNYVLGDSEGEAASQYGADTSAMSEPYDYTTNEITSDTDSSSNVLPIGAQCVSGKYQLLGYTVSSSGFDTNAEDSTSTIPSFSQSSSDEYVVVWNQTCPATPQPETGTLTVIKDVVGGTATSSDFTMHVFQGGTEVASSTPGSAQGVSYTLPAGSYTISETGGPENYLTSFSGCDANGDVTVVNGHSVTCTVINTYVGTCTQPVAHELVSRISTLTAGWTNVNPSSTPLNLNLYSGSGTLTNAVAANTVIPPWVSPASSAVWISTDANHPGEPGGEGLPGEDQWRLFEDSFNIPIDASVSPVTLYFTADNAATVYLNGSEIASTTALGTFDPAIPTPPQVFSQIYSVTFTPFVGTNTLDFVVRNEGGNYTDNPTGLLYRVVYQEQDGCGGSGANTILNLTISNGTGDGEGTVSGDGLVCDSLIDSSQCSGIFSEGSNISLTATPHDGSNFIDTWTSGPCAGTSVSPCSFIITASTVVGAHFSLNSTGGTSGGGGSTFSGGGGTSGGGISGPVTTVPTGQVLGAATNMPSGGLQYPGSVLGASATLPRTGMPPVFLFLIFASIAALADKKLKLI
jgi:Prealbumin-like fold domain/Divergent InlB B-repeat domain